jgi:hypothetical protein
MCLHCANKRLEIYARVPFSDVSMMENCMRSWYRVGIFICCVVTMLVSLPFGRELKKRRRFRMAHKVGIIQLPNRRRHHRHFNKGMHLPIRYGLPVKVWLVSVLLMVISIPERAWFVALPSWKVLSSQGGNEFQVRVTFEDKSIVVPVWDVRPVEYERRVLDA